MNLPIRAGFRAFTRGAGGMLTAVCLNAGGRVLAHIAVLAQNAQSRPCFFVKHSRTFAQKWNTRPPLFVENRRRVRLNKTINAAAALLRGAGPRPGLPRVYPAAYAAAVRRRLRASLLHPEEKERSL